MIDLVLVNFWKKFGKILESFRASQTMLYRYVATKDLVAITNEGSQETL